MHSEFMEALENSPVIAAVKDDDGLKKCLETDSSIVFILYGDICNIPQIVETVKSAGKIAMVHVDLIHGLSPKRSPLILSTSIQKPMVLFPQRLC